MESMPAADGVFDGLRAVSVSGDFAAKLVGSSQWPASLRGVNWGVPG